MENENCSLEQNVLPTTKDSHASATQQINVVDDATLQAVLSSMSETEMNAFLEELNKTGKACKKKKKPQSIDLVNKFHSRHFSFSSARYWSNNRIINSSGSGRITHGDDTTVE